MSMKGNVGTNPSRGGRTRQSEKDACDVNLIVATHRRGGVSTHVIDRVANYGFVPALSFRECMDQVRAAEQTFQALPAATRDFFHNDPARFVDYVANKDDRAKLVELGLIIPKEVVKPALGSPENPIIAKLAEPVGGLGVGSSSPVK